MRKGNGGIVGPQNRTNSNFALGVWSLSEQEQSSYARNWPGLSVTVPNAPVITGVTIVDPFTVSVAYALGATGGSPITGVTITPVTGGTPGTPVTATSSHCRKFDIRHHLYV